MQKGFPLETTLDEIQELVFPRGNVKNILMRRLKKERTFKGSVFVTFADVETAKKFADDPAPLTFKDQPLEKMMQDDYWKKKTALNKEKREAQKALKQQKKAAQQEEEKNAVNTHFVKGAVLQISGLGTDALKYEDLKTFFAEFGPVGFVAYEAGNDSVSGPTGISVL